MGQPQKLSNSKNLRGGKPRVSALDAEREASMADEGGVSAALLDIDDPEERRALHPGVQKNQALKYWIAAGLFGVVVVVGLGWLGGRAVR